MTLGVIQLLDIPRDFLNLVKEKTRVWLNTKPQQQNFKEIRRALSSLRDYKHAGSTATLTQGQGSTHA